MNKKIVTFFTTIILVSGLVCAAHAITFDFLAEANTLERGYDPYTLSIDGLTVSATGTSVSDTDDIPDFFAYLDSGDAGLGVCQGLTGTYQCNPASDDNLTTGELLSLEFDKQVTVTEIIFRDEGHIPYPATSPQDDFVLDIDDSGTYSTYDLVHVFNTPLVGTRFSFAVDDWVNGQWFSDTDQLYIASITVVPDPVPEPATMLLLGTGLAGLAGVRLRKNKK